MPSLVVEDFLQYGHNGHKDTADYEHDGIRPAHADHNGNEGCEYYE